MNQYSSSNTCGHLRFIMAVYIDNSPAKRKTRLTLTRGDDATQVRLHGAVLDVITHYLVGSLSWPQKIQNSWLSYS